MRNPDQSTHSFDHLDVSKTIRGDQTPSMRFIVLTAALSMLAGCDQIKSMLSPKEDPRPTTPKVEPQRPARPDFLYQDEVTYKGLSFLVANCDRVDRFIFNAVTGNRQFTNDLDVQAGYKFEFQNRPPFVAPYHAFVFKALDPLANLQLPSRLGKTQRGGTLVELINSVTTYKAKDDIEIKTIIAASYEFSFGLKIHPNHIQIIGGKNGKVAAIRYIGPNPEKLIGTVTLTTKTEPDPENPEGRVFTATKDKTWRLVDNQGNLFFPVSALQEQGVLIPKNALPQVREVNYQKTFTSQRITITVPIKVSVDSILDEDAKLKKKNEAQDIHWNNATGTQMTEAQLQARLNADENMSVTTMNNLSWYISGNDPLIQKIAHTVTDQFPTKEQKAQAILDFVHSFPYVPDSSKISPRAPRVALVSRGGDCKGSTILAVSLARAVGIDCAFLYMEGHVAPACDVGGQGTAFQNWDGKNWEWMETTGSLTTTTNYVDQSGRPTGQSPVVTKRPWQVGECPQNSPELLWTQRVGGPLISVRRTQHRY